MSSSQVAVLGECVADAFVSEGASPGEPGGASRGELTLRVLPGGSPANTAVALSRLGTSTRFLGRISRDSFGAQFRAHLGASGVDLTGCVTAASPARWRWPPWTSRDRPSTPSTRRAPPTGSGPPRS
ncbi:PfkB family carbohydrate kinase [Streptosporangium lutulentum]